MKVRRYVARDMRSALNQVRAEQGPDVVILSNRKVEGGVEIITAEEYDEALLDVRDVAVPTVAGLVEGSRAKPPKTLAPQHDTVAATPVRSDERPKIAGAGPEVVWTKDSLLDDMRSEIRALRSVLLQERSPVEVQAVVPAIPDAQPQRETVTPVVRTITDRLHEAGFTQDLIAALVRQIPAEADEKSAWTRVVSTLSKSVPVAKQDVFMQGGVFAFFGPTGVGKTTVIAKLAVRYSLEFDRDSVALISTDNNRLGAFDQLRTFGEMSGLSVWTVANSKELLRALAACKNKPLVLIDTAGLTFGRDSGDPLSLFNDCIGAVACQLVVSAASQPQMLTRITQRWPSIAATGLVVTKLDEAASLGSLVSELIEQNLPLTLTTSGQRIPEDLEPGRGQHLVSAAMALTHSIDETVARGDALPAKRSIVDVQA